MEFHASVLGFLTFLCYLVIAQFFLRFLMAKYSDTPLGQAMAYLF